jgi:hypothetical protein
MRPPHPGGRLPLPRRKAPPSPRVTLSGAVAKGPFVRGSSVSASPVDAAGMPTGESFSTETTDDAGRFDLTMDVEGTVLLEAEGYYYNEVTSRLSAAPNTLRSHHSFAEAGASGWGGDGRTWGPAPATAAPWTRRWP